jgi:hypothetical protein
MVLLPLMMLVSTLQDQKPDPICTADVRWAIAEPLSQGQPGLMKPTSLFSAVGQPSCLPASIRLTVAYFDAREELVCSGVVTNVAEQRSLTQMTTLELRVTNLAEFVRWRNGPAATTAQSKALDCLNADGTAVAQPAELDRAVSLHVYATVTSRYGGLATAELRLALRR